MTETDVKAHSIVKMLLNWTRSGEQVWKKVSPNDHDLLLNEIEDSATCFLTEYGPFHVLIRKSVINSRETIEGIEVQPVQIFIISEANKHYSLVPHTLLTNDLYSTVLRKSDDVSDQLEAFLTTPNPHKA